MSSPSDSDLDATLMEQPSLLESIDTSQLTDEEYEKLVLKLGRHGIFRYADMSRISDRAYYRLAYDWAFCADFDVTRLSRERLSHEKIDYILAKHRLQCFDGGKWTGGIQIAVRPPFDDHFE